MKNKEKSKIVSSMRYLVFGIKKYKIQKTSIALVIFVLSLFVFTNNASAGTIIKSPAYLGLNSGLVGYWMFDARDIYGTSARDTSGQGNHGTITQAVKTGGKLGQAFDFDGVNDTVAISSTFGLGITNVTVATWAHLDSTSEDGAFVKVGGTNAEFGFGYGIGVGASDFNDSGNNLIMLFEGVRWIDTNVNIGTGWHHVAMTLDSSSVPSIYIDGVFRGSFSGANPNAPAVRTNIGGYDSSNDRFVDAGVDDVRVYNRALSASEVQKLYNMGR